MPVHDWSRADDGTFHAFHTAWITHLSEVLNEKMLPDGYYALPEQHTGRRWIADILTLHVGDDRHIQPTEHGPVAIADAPPKVSRLLALDDAIEVAGPVLRRSESLDDETLITGAKTKGQEHLLAISQRKQLSEDVTDVLVERGNQQVVMSTASNAGARFSDFGYSTLVTRSETDTELALLVWSRPEIPREYLLTLFETASETVRQKFEAKDRGCCRTP